VPSGALTMALVMVIPLFNDVAGGDCKTL